MDIAEALQIVLDLAKCNALSETEIMEDELIYRPIAKRQHEAIEMIEDLAVNEYGDD